MQKVTDSSQANHELKARVLARGTEQLLMLLEVIDQVQPPADRALADRLSAIEEAVRLVAGTAEAAPTALRSEPLRAFSALVMRLGVECAGNEGGGSLSWNPDLAALEDAHGSLAAALMGVALALSGMQSVLGGAPSVPVAGIEGVVRVPLPEVRRWARQVEPAVSRLERDVLLRPCGPALRRDAWGLAYLVSIALAHVSDHACVDAQAALGRVADAGATLCRAVALGSSQSAGGGAAADQAGKSILALLDVIEEGARIVGDAVTRRAADSPVLAWRLLSRGRTGLGPDAIVRLAVGAVRSGRGSLAIAEGGAALARAAASYEAEWAA